MSPRTAPSEQDANGRRWNGRSDLPVPRHGTDATTAMPSRGRCPSQPRHAQRHARLDALNHDQPAGRSQPGISVRHESPPCVRAEELDSSNSTPESLLRQQRSGSVQLDATFRPAQLRRFLQRDWGRDAERDGRSVRPACRNARARQHDYETPAVRDRPVDEPSGSGR